jgi:hypothetical protein
MRAWLSFEDGALSAYMRRGIGYVTIANVEVNASRRRRGVFSRFIATVEAELRQRGEPSTLVIENVNNPVLSDWCRRHGWQLRQIGPEADRLSPTFTKEIAP